MSKSSSSSGKKETKKVVTQQLQSQFISGGVQSGQIIGGVQTGSYYGGAQTGQYYGGVQTGSYYGGAQQLSASQTLLPQETQPQYVSSYKGPARLGVQRSVAYQPIETKEIQQFTKSVVQQVPYIRHYRDWYAVQHVTEYVPQITYREEIEIKKRIETIPVKGYETVEQRVPYIETQTVMETQTIEKLVAGPRIVQEHIEWVPKTYVQQRSAPEKPQEKVSEQEGQPISEAEFQRLNISGGQYATGGQYVSGGQQFVGGSQYVMGGSGVQYVQGQTQLQQQEKKRKSVSSKSSD